jgi:hypothetical protein
MSSGERREVFNTLEEVVSGDLMRLQSFAGAHLAQALRALLLSPTTEADAGGYDIAPAASPAAGPLRAVIISGLRVVPDIDGTDMFISSGTVLVVAPDAVPNPDDCPVKLIHDDGVQISQLVLTPGDAALHRIDVVEFSVVEEAQEFDNRNVWDPNTAQFVPTTVVKVSRQQLSWRIRTGVAGVGFPGVAAGWCPVAVVQVRPLATKWDVAGVLIWDVRPLASDLVSTPHDETARYRHHWRAWGQLNYDLGVALLTAVVDTEVGNRKAGGELGAIQLSNPSVYYEPGHFPVPNALWYLWLAFPFGLPRWCQMNGVTPGTRRGIPVVSSTPVGGYTMRGEPAAPIALPDAYKLVGAAAVTECALGVVGTYEGTPKPVTMTLDGHRTYLGISSPTLSFPGLSFNETIKLSSATHHPGCASSILLRSYFRMLLSAPPPADRYNTFQRLVEWTAPVAAGGAAAAVLGQHGWYGAIVWPDATEEFTDVWEAWIPLAPSTTVTGHLERDIEYTFLVSASGVPGVVACTVSIMGWEMGT